MTNLLTVLPELDVKPFTHLLPSLERALISTTDLLTLDVLDVAKRAQLPPGEVKKLSDAVLAALHSDIGSSSASDQNGISRPRVEVRADDSTRNNQWSAISTLDDRLDAVLDGGIASGYLTEIVGER